MLTLDDINGLNAVVRLGLGRPMKRNSKKPGEKYFVTTLCGTQIPVVYDHRYNTIVTVLAADAPEVRRAMARRHKNSNSGLLDKCPPPIAASLSNPGADVSGVSAAAPGSSLEVRDVR